MYQLSYSAFLDDLPKSVTYRERVAVEQSIELLEAADKAGTCSGEALEALSFLRRLWGLFIEELSQPEHELPRHLRSDLISIGHFILNLVEEIRFGQSSNFRSLIDVSRSIVQGMPLQNRTATTR